MKYTELNIQTHRENPANARTPGAALLVRAGYISHSGEVLELGRRAIQRARRAYEALASAHGASYDSARSYFTRLGLEPFYSRESQEIFLPQETGETELVTCAGCGYVSSRELARTRKTPYSSEAALPTEKVVTPECPTIAALAAFMGLPQEKTAKALMFTRLSDGQFVFVVVRGDMTLSEAKLKKHIGDFRLASEAEIIAHGAVPGYASPIGVHDTFVIVDDLIPQSPNLVAGANEHGLHLKNVNAPRDFTPDLVADLTLVAVTDPCPECGYKLDGGNAIRLSTGSEVHFDALLPALAEQFHDDKGLTLPAPAAPFDVYLMHVPGKTLDTLSAADKLYQQLTESGLEVLFDNREERAGVKFNDADLIGCPARITIGERALQNGMAELKKRTGSEVELVALSEILKHLKA
jgi:prolyl-tRNA synthetase